MQIIETIDFRDIQIVWEFNSKKCLVSLMSWHVKCVKIALGICF